MDRPQNVLTDGFPTLFGFGSEVGDSNDSTMGIILCEKRLKPFGIDGGGPNDTTCMRNTLWRTRQSKKLITLTDMSLTVSYDPLIYNDITGVPFFIQTNQLMYLAWPDGSGVSFWGFVDTFEPSEVSEGSQPEAEMKIVPTNTDDEGQEVGPAYDPSFWNPHA